MVVLAWLHSSKTRKYATTNHYAITAIITRKAHHNPFRAAPHQHVVQIKPKENNIVVTDSHVRIEWKDAAKLSWGAAFVAVQRLYSVHTRNDAECGTSGNIDGPRPFSVSEMVFLTV